MKKLTITVLLSIAFLTLSQCKLLQKYIITIEIEGSGSVTRNPDAENYCYEEEVILTAEPEGAWRFNRWEGDVESTTEQITVIMDDDKSLKVVFDEPPSYTLTCSWKSKDSANILTAASSSAASQPITGRTSTAGGTGREEERRFHTIDRTKYTQSPQKPRGIIVKYREEAIKNVESGGWREVLSTAVGLRAAVVEPEPGATIEETVAYYNSLPEVEYAEPNYPVRAHGDPNDPLFSYQWNFLQLEMPSVWDAVTGDSSVIVAVVDTGIDQTLSDLAATTFVSGYDFINGDDNPVDDDGHGSHVAGTIAQSTNNNLGVAGMAYGVSLMPIKSLDNAGLGYVADIANGIIWAADHGADVINLSLGTPDYSSTLEDACRYAYEQGAALFASAGNSGSPPVEYPAAFDTVIAVGATEYAVSGSDPERAPYSNYGPKLGVVAPGGNNNEDRNNDTYKDGILQQTIAGDDGDPTTDYYDPVYSFYEGTSMSCPHAAALAALLFSKDAAYSVDEVYELITSTAVDLGAAGRDDYFGYGLISPPDALGATVSIYALSDSVTEQYDITTLKDRYNVKADAGAISAVLEFEPEVGDLDLYLYNSAGGLVVSATTQSDTASLYFFVGFNSDTYMIEVRGDE